jgi:prophage regulatory protein
LDTALSATKGERRQIRNSKMILRIDQVKSELGHRSHSSIYTAVHDGMMTTPVRLGKRSVGWPDYEISALAAARIAGKTDDEIRAQVIKLHSDRVTDSDQPFVSDFYERSARIKQQAQGRVKRGTVATV